MPTSAEDLGFTTTYFELQGLRMHAVVAGPPDAPLVILLHGFPEGWPSYRKQIGPLAAAGYRVVAPDQRGYNLTSKAGPYDLDTLSNDAIHLLQACGRSKAHWVGHDWGAAVAWKLAERYPERVETLTIINVPHTAIALRSVAGGNFRQMLRSWYVAFFQIPWLPEWLLSRNGFALMRQALQASARPGTFSQGDIEDYVAAWSQPGSLSAMLGWYRTFMRASLLSPRRATRLPIYEMPAQIIWGERDTALGVELGEASAKLLKHGRLLRLPQATHWVHHEFPEVVNGYILEMFRSDHGFR